MRTEIFLLFLLIFVFFQEPVLAVDTVDAPRALDRLLCQIL
jgi:hypothetical protein